MKKLEKYKIVPQAKFVKFKVKHFVEIPTIRHDKAVPPLLDCLKSSPPWMCPHPGSWSLAVAPPAWLMTQKSSPMIPGGGGHYVNSIWFIETVWKCLQYNSCHFFKKTTTRWDVFVWKTCLNRTKRFHLYQLC